MFGNLSYLISIFCFAGLAIMLEWIFGFNLLKKYLRIILTTIGLVLLSTPTEAIALYLKAWAYTPTHTFNLKLLGAELETYIFVIFIAIAISSATIAWTRYEDLKKNILKQSLIDIFKGTYAIWKK